MSTTALPRIPAALVALAALATWGFYLRINRTPTIMASVFFAVVAVAAVLAATALWRALRLVLLAGVAGACVPFGVLSMPSLFGLLPLGVATLALGALAVALVLEWLVPRRGEPRGALWAIAGGLVLGLGFFVAIFAWAVAVQP